MNKNKNSRLVEWLDTLQQESWQLELLISGFAIFGLFELRSFLGNQVTLLNANLHSGINDTALIASLTILFGAFLITHVFIINLILHVCIRGLWIGALGLRYVSGDIDYNQIKYNQRFIQYYKNIVGDFDSYIIKLEKISSVIFSFTFLLFFIFFSVFLFVIELIFFQLLSYKLLALLSAMKFSWILKVINLILFLLGGLVAFDFITLGLLKKIKQKHFSTVYFFIYRFIGIVTLSFLWRPLLLNFLDQKDTRKLFLLIIPYIALILILPSSNIFEYSFFPNLKSINDEFSYKKEENVIYRNSFNKEFYDSMNLSVDDENYTIKILSIPSNKVKGNIFEVFVKYNLETEKYISFIDSSIIEISKKGFSNQVFNASVFNKSSGGKAITSYENFIKVKNLIKNSFTFSIDEQMIPMDKMSCDFYIHPNSGEKGMLCFFPIDLEVGKHYLSFQKYQLSNLDNKKIDTLSLSIPFIFEGK